VIRAGRQGLPAEFFGAVEVAAPHSFAFRDAIGLLEVSLSPVTRSFVPGRLLPGAENPAHRSTRHLEAHRQNPHHHFFSFDRTSFMSHVTAVW
jgi:hypothetical protein